MATATVACRFRSILLRHDILESLENGIHGSVAMRARLPFVVDLGVAAALATAFRPRKRARVKSSIGRGMSETGGRGGSRLSVAVVCRENVAVSGP